MSTIYWGVGGIILLVAFTLLFTWIDSVRDGRWKQRINKIKFSPNSPEHVRRPQLNSSVDTDKFLKGKKIRLFNPDSTTPVI
ncbi:MAG TPA: hypothetical protein VL651_13355 [Bacteroidia bacterium]|jgi:hypothetical protein|nr:hypothetical protein [Bacteroidia bacterium]